MSQTSRELVTSCLRFEAPQRIPRDLWTLPWASNHYPEQLEEIKRRYPADLGNPTDVYAPSPRKHGDPYVVGTYVDEWGSIFTNIQAGVHGEVRTPVLPDLRDWRTVQPPFETLPPNYGVARDAVNRSCGSTDLFVLAGACPRPWERYQFLRGSQNALTDIGLWDVVLNASDGRSLLRVIHEFYMKELEFWAATDVDALKFMDDWGAQRRLLISPRAWREIFKPLYKEYCDLAHAYGKFIFMHSDGHILDIYPDLIEVGVDAINSQLFCMDLAQVAERAKGRITFWGEMDRQHVVPAADPQVGRDAVRKIVQHLYDPKGGLIAQLEFGPSGNPETIMAIYDEWEKVHSVGYNGVGYNGVEYNGA